ncbi:hypothetical protein A2914_01045 [Candidatus Nomurabacteria bacterium RIFCSPLOWO2_01_FULL_41_21]|uniref:Nudix hydrolase domain-containing protein n=2 Tax=Candidatus Nomuraibacteriota TaxID=1752729 RepID=A0A1F6V2S8_9BACT|nr:MAG: hypothetical protein A2733_02135 [Candidatus Nomurabacteria bacterium RIFCSPHIGHO2_01_FULL_40_20]OGI87901.1 MAG: hypothetical protein A2914_01045 [Candidatus Nomurabacteria bacterium RIFCSPLOWO2_01_FULL_41_21]
METKWHLRVRGIIKNEGKFLVFENDGHCALLGGHVEEGESVPEALKREILEEAGVRCEVKEYLGAIEQAWERNGEKHWEITHYFDISVLKPENIKPMEEDLIFTWITPAEFESKNLLPIPLRELLKSWAKGERKTWWGSDM